MAGAVPAQAARNSNPAQVMMVATMPASFSLQAQPAALMGASGSVQVTGAGRNYLVIHGRTLGQGANAVVSIPIQLATNTQSFVVQARMEGGTGAEMIRLHGTRIMGRARPMRGETNLAMGVAGSHEYFALNHPLHGSLEIYLGRLPAGQERTFQILLSVRDLGY